MEENNGMQENKNIFGRTDTGYESKADSGLDRDTFGSEADIQKEQKTTVYTQEWSPNTDSTAGQAAYGTQSYAPGQPEKNGEALEICALIFGIISLCGCCYGLFGVVGLVLSIVAIATGRKSGFSIAGLILSILGIGIVIILIIFNFGSAGKQWGHSFINSFQQGFEEGYDTEAGFTSEDQEGMDGDDSAGGSDLSGQVMGKVIIDGREVTIPCKLSELRSDFELSTYGETDLDKGLDADDTEIVHLLSDGNETGIRIMIRNPKNTAVADINDTYVVSVWMDDYAGADTQVKFFKDITVGLGQDELEKLLGDESYDKEEEDSWEYYKMESDNFILTVYVEEGIVSEIDVDYYGDCE